jgi:hypothetical protein
VDTFEKEIRAFRENWARDPDITLLVLSTARRALADLTDTNTDKGKACAFLLKYLYLVREKNGTFRIPRITDAGKRVDLVPTTSPRVSLEELARLTFGAAYTKKKIKIMANARQFLSWKIEKTNKGNRYYFIPKAKFISFFLA